MSSQIADRAECRREAARYRPGPLVRGRTDCALDGGEPATRLRFICGGLRIDAM